jgi:hypothetical protein
MKLMEGSIEKLIEKTTARRIALDMDGAENWREEAACMARNSGFAGDLCRLCEDICQTCGDERAKHQPPIARDACKPVMVVPKNAGSPLSHRMGSG